MRYDLLAFLALPFLGFSGAYSSQKIKKSNKLIFIPPLVSFAVGWLWVVVAKHTKMSLATAQIAFDTTYVLYYFLAFLLLGESITFRQGLGAGFAITGIVLLSL